MFDQEMSVMSGDEAPPQTTRRRTSASELPAVLSDSDSLTDSEQYRERIRVGTSLPPQTIEEKHHQMDALFGIMPFKASVTEKPLELHSEVVQKLYAKPSEPLNLEPVRWYSCSSIGNYIWVIICGWWLFLVYLLVACALFVTFVGRYHGRVCFNLAKYYLWPFGKVVLTYGDQNLGESEGVFHKKKHNRPLTRIRNCSAGQVVWSAFAWTILLIANLISFCICWSLVVFIPMAKVMQVSITDILFSPAPLEIEITQGYPDTESNVIVWTFVAANKNYYKYTAFGVNVVLLNFFPLVLLALFFAYIPYLVPSLRLPDLLMFVICIISVIPLAYYIGLALSSLSTQTSFTVGAVLNATFGSVIELILYVAALLNGMGTVVQSSITGSLLGLMLFLPGLSMLLGGMKNPDMKFNPVSAGVSGVLLLISVLGLFTPTVYYQIYGSYTLECGPCEVTPTSQTCGDCQWVQMPLEEDPVYTDYARHLSYCVAAILPLSYLVGLIFTLKTHAHVVDDPAFIDKQAADEHVPLGPKWSKLKCLLVLLGSTLLFGLLAEEIVHTLEPTLELFGISSEFAGVTLIAIVSYTAEFVNAIQFAIHNNFSMSLEIANCAAVQVALIQVPVLVLVTFFYQPAVGTTLTLIFPVFDVFTVLLAVIVMNYISIEGKANYFLGFSLLIVYVLFVSAYFYVPSSETVEYYYEGL